MNAVSAPAGGGALPDSGTAGGDVLLSLDNVVKYYPVRVGVVVKREVAAVKAVDGVDLEIRRGESPGCTRSRAAASPSSGTTSPTCRGARCSRSGATSR